MMKICDLRFAFECWRVTAAKGLAVLFVVIACLSATAEYSFPYRGRIDGSPGSIPSTLNVTFSLYNEPAGGTALWSHSYDIKPAANGFFQTDLTGDDLKTALTGGNARYLGVKLGDGSEQYPRQRLFSTPLVSRALTAKALASSPLITTSNVKALQANTFNITSDDSVNLRGKLKLTSANAELRVAKLVPEGRVSLKAPRGGVSIFRKSSPDSYTFGSGVSSGQTLFTSACGGAVTIITDGNWTSPCVTFFAGPGEVKAPFGADGQVRVYHYPFNANN